MKKKPKSQHGGPRDGAGRKKWKDPGECKVSMSVSLAPDCIAYLATQSIKSQAIEAALRAQRDRLFDAGVDPPKPVPPARVMMAIDRLAATFRYYAGPATPGYNWSDAFVYDAIRTDATHEATETAIQSDLILVAKSVIAAREEATQ